MYYNEANSMILEDHDIYFRDSLKLKAESQTDLKLTTIDPSTLNNNLGYVVGTTYYIGYWGTIEKCIEVNDNYILVEDANHNIRTHYTKLNPITDFIIG